MANSELIDDAVSRQAVLDELRTCFDTHSIYDENNGENYIIYEDAVDMMENLPPVTPTRKVGHWEHDYDKNAVDEFDPIIRCPFCGYTTTAFAENEYDCCPKCGSYLKGGEE